MRTTTPWALLLLLGSAVLLTKQDGADTPGTSPTKPTPAARISATPLPQPASTPTAGLASAVAMVPRPPETVTVIDAASTRSSIESARRPAATRIAAIVPAPAAGKSTPDADDDAEALAAAIESPPFQDTVSPLVRLYLAYFERVPDYEGLDYYIDQRERGRLLDDIADEFAGSREIGTRYGSLDNAAFVDRVYRNVFEGAGDADQRASWVAQLESGAVTRGQMMLAFSESAAFRTATANEVFVAMAYAEVLGRMVPAAELAHWVAFLDAGHTSEAVIQILLAGR
jgi:hypothetical protein